MLIFVSTGTAFLREQTSATSGSELRVRARYAAESGMQMALRELFNDDDWASGVQPHIQFVDISEDGSVQAKIEVWSNSSGGTTLTTGDGVQVAPGKAYLVSTGVIAGREFGGALGAAKSIVARPRPELNYALEDRGFLNRQALGDAWIDGYDSKIETPTDPVVYNWSTGQPSLPPSVPPYGGRGGAKVKSASFVRMKSPCFGDIYLPEGEVCDAPQHFGSIVRDDSLIEDIIFEMPKALEDSSMQPAFLPNLSPGRYGVVNVPDGMVVTLGRGDYAFRELNLGRGTRLELTANPSDSNLPAVLYIEDKFEVGPDSLVNMTFSGQEPQARQLQIFGTDRVEQVSYNNLGNVVGTIFDFRNGSRVRACLGSYKAWFRYGLPSGLSPQTPNNAEPSGRLGVDLFGGIYGVQIADVPGVRYHYDKALEGQVLEGTTKWALEHTAQN